MIENWREVYKKIFNDALAAFDTSEYEQMLKDKIDKFLGKGTTITLTDGPTIEYSLDTDNSKIIIKNAKGLDQATLQAKLNDQLKAQGLSLEGGAELDGGGFEFTITSTVAPSSTQELVSAQAVSDAKTQLDDVKK